MADVTIAAGDDGTTTTLVANVVSTITFADNIGGVELVSDGSAPIVWTADGTTPVLAANDTSRHGRFIPAVVGVDRRATTNTGAGPTGIDVVKVRSTGTPTITVQKLA